MQPTNIHFATVKGMTMQPLFKSLRQLFWMIFDQSLVDKYVIAVKISEI